MARGSPLRGANATLASHREPIGGTPMRPLRVISPPGRMRSDFHRLGEELAHARPLFHPLEMRLARPESGKIEAELHAASKAPEEIGIDGGERSNKKSRSASRSSAIR